MNGPALRVTFDHQIFVGQAYGGASRYFAELAQRVARLPRFRVRVVAPLHSNEYLRRSCVTTLGLFAPIPGARRLQSALARAMWPALRRATQPHLVHSTYYGPVPERAPGARVVVTVHDMIHERFPELFAPGDATTRRKRAAVAAADHVICVSEHTRRDLVDCFGIAPERTTVVHHGCDPATLRVPAGAEGPGRPYVLHVGPRQGYKNFDRLLEAFASSPALVASFELVAFGGGPWSATERERIRALGVAHRVRRAGGSDGELARLYAGASALAMPSMYEGFGIPLIEAMSFGCVVACSDTSSAPEVAGDAARYFDPRDPASIRCALEDALGSAALREALRERGRARAARFSWDATAARTAEVYLRVAGG